MEETSRNRIRADIVTYCRNGEAMIRRRGRSRLRGRYENSKNQSKPATLLEIRPDNLRSEWHRIILEFLSKDSRHGGEEGREEI